MAMNYRAMPDISQPPRMPARALAPDKSGSWRSSHMAPRFATPPWPAEHYVDPRLTVQGTEPTRQLPRFVPYAYLDPSDFSNTPQ